MKNGLKWILIVVVIVAIFSGIFLFFHHQTQEQIEAYEAALAGKVYQGYDSNKTAQHGTARFSYTLTFRADGTCSLRFKYSKTDDDSLWSTNKTEEFTMEDVNWYVEKEGDAYYVRFSVGWDFREYSAAKLNRQFEILDYDGINLIATRSGYHDVYFSTND